jgi:beta-glucosidase
MSFPVDVGQVPISYNELPTGRPYDQSNKYTSRYLDVVNAPLYPFGWGLSYTSFSLSGLHLSSASPSRNGPETVTARITNTGSTAGDDVMQLYLREKYTRILQPLQKLEGFQRVTLGPGKSKTVTFHLGRQNLGYYNNRAQFVNEPGPYDVWVGDGITPSLHGMFTTH